MYARRATAHVLHHPAAAPRVAATIGATLPAAAITETAHQAAVPTTEAPRLREVPPQAAQVAVQAAATVVEAAARPAQAAATAQAQAAIAQVAVAARAEVAEEDKFPTTPTV